MERYSNGWCKVYLAEFKNVTSNDVFYKVGYTAYKDAADRFRYESDQYKKWNIRILSTIICNSTFTAKMIEKIFHLHYPKNFWLEEKIVGVTEIFKVDREKYLDLLRIFRTMNEHSKAILDLKDKT